MSEGTPHVSPARRHLIERPRLTRLLDETNARIILLVAPAGYGKTTLARQWLEGSGRKFAWYTATPASEDLAHLAAGLARAAGNVVPEPSRVLERLSASSAPQADPQTLGSLLAADLQGWPNDAWFVLDDYDRLTSGAGCDRFVEALAAEAPVQLLITARRRPIWIGTRQLVYAEAFLLGRAELAFTRLEAEAALRSTATDVAKVAERSQGWPAVIGLARLARSPGSPPTDPPAMLHDYFAEELFLALRAETQDFLLAISAAPRVSKDLAAHLCGEGSEDALAASQSAGYLVGTPTGDYELHPLLRDFLSSKRRERGVAEQQMLETLASYYLGQRDWDAVFEIAKLRDSPELVAELVEHGAEDMLATGRLATVTRWLTLAPGSSPHVSLAEAEIALRRGDYSAAETFARAASRAPETEKHLRSRSFVCAGRVAGLRDEPTRALEYFEQAEATAVTKKQLKDALWGAFNVLVDLDRPSDARKALEEFAAVGQLSEVDALRLISGQVLYGNRYAEKIAPLSALDSEGLRLLKRVRDPMVRTSFLNSYVYCLVLAARYQDALKWANELVTEAAAHALTFVLPHAHTVQASTFIGLRRFKRAHSSLDAALRTRTSEDTYAYINSVALRARLWIAEGQPDRAIGLTNQIQRTNPSAPMAAELLATEALAAASLGEAVEAERLAREAEETSLTFEPRIMALAARCVAAVNDSSSEAEALAGQLWDAATSTQSLDSLVTAYRACPPLIPLLSRMRPEGVAVLSELITRARDVPLGRAAGMVLASPSRQSDLSPREEEVYNLLVQGLRNKEIAQILFISEVTVKVHVRHIFQKLGIRNRTEAAIRATGVEDD